MQKTKKCLQPLCAEFSCHRPSSSEPSQPKNLRGTTEVNLLSTAGRPRLSKVWKPRFVLTEKDHFEIFISWKPFSWSNGRFCLVWGPSICILWPINFFVTSWDRSGTSGWNLVLTILQGTSVAIITVKTGAQVNAESLARVVLDLCGSEGGCCQTSTDGRGLDNPGEDRRKGQVDVYTATSILGNCAEQVVW